MLEITNNPLHDFWNYDYEQSQKKEYCYFCERIISKEKAYRIHNDLICCDCLEERYSEVIE